MNDWDECEDFDEDPLEADCDYGFEFCEHPDIRDMGLCTTECSLYMDAVKEDSKGEKYDE